MGLLKGLKEGKRKEIGNKHKRQGKLKIIMRPEFKKCMKDFKASRKG